MRDSGAEEDILHDMNDDFSQLVYRFHCDKEDGQIDKGGPRGSVVLVGFCRRQVGIFVEGLPSVGNLQEGVVVDTGEWHLHDGVVHILSTMREEGGRSTFHAE